MRRKEHKPSERVGDVRGGRCVCVGKSIRKAADTGHASIASNRGATKIVRLVLYMRDGSESDPCAVVSSGGLLARNFLLVTS